MISVISTNRNELPKYSASTKRFKFTRLGGSVSVLLNITVLICCIHRFMALEVVTSSSTTPRSHYKALVAESVGDTFADVARIRSLPVPTTLGKDEALIRVVYAGVNGGCETFRARGEYAFRGNKEKVKKDDDSSFFGLGAEGVGIVQSVGSDVTNVNVGDAVCFVGSAFAEYSTVPSKSLWIIPEATAEYVGLRISALTSFSMLERTGGGIKSGDVVLITAAAGGAGHFAVQCAKLAGCTVIGTCSSSVKAQILREKLGCDHVINYKTHDLKTELHKIAPDGVDVVLEGVGGTILQTALDAMTPKGRLLQIGYISEYPHNNDNKQSSADNEKKGFSSDDIFWNKKTIQRGEQTIYGNAWPSSMDNEMKDRVLELYAKGKLQSLVDDIKTFDGLESVTDAIDHMLSGTTIGKVVVKI